MPFKSPRQERFLFAKHPDIAKKWQGEAGNAPGFSKLAAYFKGGEVKDKEEQEEQPEQVIGAGHKPMKAAFGAKVPGAPKVPGDSPRNDTVIAKVSPGEVILPRSVSTAPNAPDKAKRFMALHKYFGR